MPEKKSKFFVSTNSVRLPFPGVLAFILFFSIVIPEFAIAFSTSPGAKPMLNESFTSGETLEFRMNYSFLTVGRLTSVVGLETSSQRGASYKLEVFAKSAGVARLVSDLENRYVTMVDTAVLFPIEAYRKQREGRYRHEEMAVFDQSNRRVTVKTMNNKTGQWNTPVTHKLPSQSHDLLSGIYHLRTLPTNRLKQYDTIAVSGFYEDEYYAIRIIYLGKKVVKTGLGKINSLAFMPIMPPNSLFVEKNPVVFYLSDDKNKVPVRIEAKMIIGNAAMELTNASNLRNPLNLIQESK